MTYKNKHIERRKAKFIDEINIADLLCNIDVLEQKLLNVNTENTSLVERSKELIEELKCFRHNYKVTKDTLNQAYNNSKPIITELENKVKELTNKNGQLKKINTELIEKASRRRIALELEQENSILKVENEKLINLLDKECAENLENKNKKNKLEKDVCKLTCKNLILKAENERYKNALEEIINTIKFIQERAERGNKQIDGMMAIQASKSPCYLKDIARKALEGDNDS